MPAATLVKLNSTCPHVFKFCSTCFKFCLQAIAAYFPNTRPGIVDRHTAAETRILTYPQWWNAHIPFHRHEKSSRLSQIHKHISTQNLPSIDLLLNQHNLMLFTLKNISQPSLCTDICSPPLLRSTGNLQTCGSWNCHGGSGKICKLSTFLPEYIYPFKHV